MDAMKPPRTWSLVLVTVAAVAWVAECVVSLRNDGVWSMAVSIVAPPIAFGLGALFLKLFSY